MDVPNHNSPTLILGAGLTGLSAAHELSKHGASYRLVERSSQVGGHVVTVEDEGFRFDRTGHLLHLRDPSVREWVQSLLADELLTVQRRSLVYSNGVFTRYPFQANTFGLPPSIAYECVMGFLEARNTRFEQAPRDFEEFCVQTFGKGFSKHFMIPYNARLWGVEPSEITTEWCARFVPQPKLEDVIAGAVGLNDRELGYNSSFVYPKRGIGALPGAMANSLRVELNTAPSAIDWRKKIAYFGSAPHHYETLISTMPLSQLVGLMSDVPASVSAAAPQLRCNPLCYLDVALNRPTRREFHWVYVPEARFPFYRVGAYSSFSPHVAPEGCASLYVELVDRNPDPVAVTREAIRSLIEMGIIETDADVRFSRFRRLEHAYVIYDHHYTAARRPILQFLEEQSILSVGRYGGWNYSSMEDAILFGRDAAQRALQLQS